MDNKKNDYNAPSYNDAPFDDDDLINDYMDEDDIGPPQEYDDAFFDEMMGDEGQKKGNGQEQPQPQFQPQTQPPQSNATMLPSNNNNGTAVNIYDNNDDGDVLMEDIVDSTSIGVRASSAIPNEVTIDDRIVSEEGRGIESLSQVRKDRDSQLYSFERYSDRFQWRKKSSQSKREEDDVMAATVWKRKINDNNDHQGPMEGKRQKTNAPESQLVQFLSGVIKGDSYVGNTDSSNTGSINNCRLSSFTSKDRFRVESNLPVENEESSPVTIEGGRMLYIPKLRNDTKYLRCDDKTMNKDGNNNEVNNCLLGTPMSEITKRAETIERRNDRRKRIKRDREISKNVSKHNGEEKKIDDEVHRDKVMNKSKFGRREIDKKSQLWVDKHCPVTFSDLLSDERTNREVLRALRQWDPFVFHKDAPPRPQFHRDSNNQQNDPTSSSSAMDEKNDSQLLLPNKDDIRPDEQNRVILLSGPPGVGKTTLAHIIARHAGYRPLEVNASDERSASVLTERVTRAMESTTLNLKKLNGIEDDMVGRPNCLILDEIDGADAKSSVAALVEIIRAEKLSGGGSKKKGKKTYLRRPIIFICNHKYAPALRPLLPFACQFDVLPPSSNRLVSRLKGVLGAENMTLISGSSLLRQLVASSGGDIRSCLFTLQFASARAKELFYKKKKRDGGVAQDYHNSVIDISPVLNSSLNGNGKGMKDMRSDIAGTLRTIFRKLKSKKHVGSSFGTSSSLRDVERVLNTVETFSDPSKTLDGLFMNLMNVSYIDPTLDRCWTAHEWLSCADIYRSHKTSLASTNHAAHRTIQKCHIPSAAAAVHILCRVETSSDLTYSLRPLFDSIYQLEANNGLIRKFFEGLSPQSRSGISSYGYTSEVLPYCLRLLSAGVGSGALNRAVSSIDILTKEEKISFDTHVEMLRVLGLTYKKVEDDQTQDTSQQIEMQLEPQIDQVLQFQGLNASDTQRRNIPPALKELLAHATSVARLRAKEKHEDVTNKEKKASKTLSEKVISGTGMEDAETNNKATITNELLKKLKKDKAVVGMNFLGLGAEKARAARTARKAAQVGFRKKNKKEKMSNTGSGVPLQEVIKFKYLKGFTQAVRLPCNKDDFTIL